jgi:hypothetical protein
MERYCSTGQSQQRAVAPTEEEEEDINRPGFEMSSFEIVIAIFLLINMLLTFSFRILPCYFIINNLFLLFHYKL